ncbi:hypothetical protein [Candidatus Soleaferrea massiliensis]|uniref:hypothetical protein n=1 Tax=Candidatus Soleaferrea massiliensis TaxID=1470354 RepID=UPI0012E0AA3A|nr:hypothetical protein [Candidatus Soleaferrea massiliensis]
MIKGGPGTGKSTLCKQVAKAASEFTDNIEFLHCSSDPHSLDGVIISDYKISLFDATSPHVVEPKYPGAFESVINLCDCWDEDALQQNRDEVVALFAANQGCHARCSKFLAASGSLLNDTYHIALECTNIPKLSRYVTRLISRELKAKAAGTGQEKVRFLSAVTVGGLMMFTDTAKAYCDRVYVIDDNYGSVCRLLLHSIRAYALKSGYDIITCYCPLSPYDKIEHLFIPELGLGFMTSNKFHPLTFEAYKHINSNRFLDLEQLKKRKQRIHFNQRIINEMLAESGKLVTQSKVIHDDLEKYYTQNTDFDKVAAKIQETTDKVRKIILASDEAASR